MKRIRKHISYANVAATMALLFAMSGGAIAATGGFTSGGTLKACANEEGVIRLLRPGKSCKKGQKSVSWNQAGTAGAKGPNGAAGAPGAAGATGVAGPKGETGANGTARAYAVVMASGDVVAARTRNLSASKLATGQYCVTPSTSSGIERSAVQPVAVADFLEGPGPDHIVQSFTATQSEAISTCPSGWIFVTDRFASGEWARADVAFTVMVP